MADDLSKLSDEELDKKLEESQQEESPIEAPEPAEPEKEEAEDSTEEVAEPEAEVEKELVEEAEEETQGEEPEKPSRREQLRINQLLEKYGPPQQDAPKAGGIDYNQLEAEPEVIQQLEADRQAQANAAYQQGLAQSQAIQFHTRLELDAPKVESKFSQLNSESSDFDPAVADSINSEYLRLVGYDAQTDTVINPNIRYADFVEARYEQAERLARSKVASTQKNIAKQSANTGLRPDGSAAKSLNLNKPAHLMSDEELEAKINSVIK